MSLPMWVQYINALGPLVALVAGLTAAAVAYRTYHHRRRQDRKDEWWRRTQWALDNVTRPDGLARDLGLDVLHIQATSGLADREDHRVMAAVARRLLLSTGNSARFEDADVEYDDLTSPDGGNER